MFESKILQGDCLEVLKTLPDNSIHCTITSPPYWGLRNYVVNGQLGLEKTPQEYVTKMVEVFREVKRVLCDDGTLWLNLGDSYHGSWGNSGKRPELDGTESTQREKNCDYISRGGWDNRRERPPSSYKIEGLKPKDLVGIPWMTAFALRADGWYLRSDIIWNKKNCMPESCTDRPTKSHEYIFLLSKSANYYYDSEAIKEPNQDSYNGKRGTTETRKKMQSAMRDFSDKESMHKYSTEGRNKRDVWTIATMPYKGAHFATFPLELIKPCVLAGCPEGGTILDPFGGSGTTGVVAKALKRNSILIELNPKYCKMAEKRINGNSMF
jgi:DNA modification methylase